MGEYFNFGLIKIAGAHPGETLLGAARSGSSAAPRLRCQFSFLNVLSQNVEAALCRRPNFHSKASTFFFPFSSLPSPFLLI